MLNCLYTVFNCFLIKKLADLSIFDGHMAYKAENIYYWAFYRKSLLTCALYLAEKATQKVLPFFHMKFILSPQCATAF